MAKKDNYECRLFLISNISRSWTQSLRNWVLREWGGRAGKCKVRYSNKKDEGRVAIIAVSPYHRRIEEHIKWEMASMGRLQWKGAAEWEPAHESAEAWIHEGRIPGPEDPGLRMVAGSNGSKRGVVGDSEKSQNIP